MVESLSVAVILSNGIVAGVFFAVLVSVLPTLFAMPLGQYVETHRLLGKGYHPAMPVIVNVGTVGAVLLAFLAPSAATKALFGAAAVLLVGVQAVSHLLNVPINRKVHAVDLDRLPAGWRDPRPAWRNWHQLRTALAFAAFLANSTAVVLAA
nr:hypothetical protein [uncultured bacterium]